ncbi:class I SAM-dependent methyltransferase [uncultured Draconibacterium sp.]|uniref:class I SAM-dependent methyltransferase n=1 Tax=uncultured Draconibacterium sp. TaxID=1573823 RepID=UPI0032165BC4
MEDLQNKFYSSISTFYSEIFPYNPMQLNFVQACVGKLHNKHMLDIGCATGELAFQLAKAGSNVIGIDLNEDLLASAVGSSGIQSADSSARELELELPNPKFQKRNMLELKQDFQGGEFDAVLCFGNTLVHLNSEEEVLEMFEGVKTVVKPGGQFLIQLLNYDYIVGEQRSELPLIDTENIRFVRKYKFPEDGEHILFQTDLEIKAENKTVSNETTLLALKSSKLTELLEIAGFKNIQLFANFKQEAFGGNHIPLVVSCQN